MPHGNSPVTVTLVTRDRPALRGNALCLACSLSLSPGRAIRSAHAALCASLRSITQCPIRCERPHVLQSVTQMSIAMPATLCPRPGARQFAPGRQLLPCPRPWPCPGPLLLRGERRCWLALRCAGLLGVRAVGCAWRALPAGVSPPPGEVGGAPLGDPNTPGMIWPRVWQRHHAMLRCVVSLWPAPRLAVAPFGPARRTAGCVPFDLGSSWRHFSSPAGRGPSPGTARCDVERRKSVALGPFLPLSGLAWDWHMYQACKPPRS
jgi:hypothetical protein